jgi:hypothetical protein
METRYPAHPKEFATFSTERLRKDYLIDDLFVPGKISLTYSHVDRIIIGGICPAGSPLMLEAGKELAPIILWNAAKWASSILAARAALQLMESLTPWEHRMAFILAWARKKLYLPAPMRLRQPSSTPIVRQPTEVIPPHWYRCKMRTR